MTKKIHIFVNNKYLIKISKLSSLYTLKEEVKKKLNYTSESNIELNVELNGKILSNDDLTLLTCGIENNSNINVSPVIKGGNKSTFVIYFIYFICIISFFIFLISGIIPVISSLFFRLLSDTLEKLVSRITTKSKLLIRIIKIILWILQHCGLILFIWATTFYLIWPMLYNRKNDYCNSGLAAKDVGGWITLVYVFIYFAYNAPNIIADVINDIFDISNNSNENTTGKLNGVKKIFSSSMNSLKYTWDSIKFLPIYWIPSVKLLHNGVDTGLSYVYLILDSIEKNSCDKLDRLLLLDTFLQNLKKYMDKDKKSLSIEDFKKMQEEIEKQNSAEQLMKVMTDSYMSNSAYFVNEKLGKHKFDILATGVHDLYLKKTNQSLPKLEGSLETGKFERSLADIIVDSVCFAIDMSDGVYDRLKLIGDANTVANMIKTGQVAGIITSIVFFILIIWLFFVSSFGGYTYG